MKRLLSCSKIAALFCFLFAGVGLFSATPLAAQKVGDQVVVTATSETKIYKESVGKVYEGEIHTIPSIN